MRFGRAIHETGTKLKSKGLIEEKKEKSPLIRIDVKDSNCINNIDPN